MRIKITHFRRLTGNGGVHDMRTIRAMGLTRKIDPRGGVTLAEVYDEDGNLVAMNEARCSLRDNYNKSIGRLIATGRAMKGLYA